MYESFYGFDQRPFLTIPTLDRYFPSTSVEQAYQTVARAIQRCEGPVAIFGGAGLGKTMCCLRIAASVSQQFEVVTLASSQVITRRALLQTLLYELRMPYRDMSEGELRLNLLERLQPSDEHANVGLVLIVDEAQTLSTKLLEELRILTNVVRQGVPRIRLVLCGTMKLEELLSHPHMESLNQRLAARCYLTPLNHDECDRYVKHKVELCGVRWNDVFANDALEAIYRASDGIPRLIDQVADQALLQGAREKIRPINAVVVGYAWSLLQQLPNPWSDPTPPRSGFVTEGDETSEEFSEEEGSHIEFGSLDEVPETEAYPFSAPFAPSFEDEAPTIPIALNDEGEREELAVSSDEVEAERDTFDTENLLAAFTDGFEDEFDIPIQSLDGYQHLSGIALGDLNHDADAFEESQKAMVSEPLEEADAFLDLRIDKPHNADPSWSPNEVVAATLTGKNPNDTFGVIEQQIEEEMRDLVSNLNLSAMTIERDEPNQLDLSSIQDDADMLVEDAESTEEGHVYYAPSDGMGISFAYLQVGQPTQVVADDRDMIVIDEGVGEVKQPAVRESTEPKARASIHPYAQLFSKLRPS